MLEPLDTAVLDKRQIAESTMEFIVKRPSGFAYDAGQHLLLRLTELLFDDVKGARRAFTMASAPHEDELRIATRMTGSGFKRSLIEGANQRVEIIGPRGSLIRDAARPAVFIAGGIGVTPFRSMILDAVYRRIEQPTTLIVSNRTLERAAFHDLFVEVQQQHGNIFTYVPTFTNEKSDRSWFGERRSLDIELFKNIIDDWTTSTFYVCGPPAMVTAASEMLKKQNVSQEYILSESFWGYDA